MSINSFVKAIFRIFPRRRFISPPRLEAHFEAAAWRATDHFRVKLSEFYLVAHIVLVVAVHLGGYI